MGSDSVAGTASVAAKADNVRTLSHLKRGRVQDEGDESTAFVPPAKRQHVNPHILQSLNSKLRLLEQSARSKIIPFALGAPDVLREFEYSESEIQILKVIGSGDHSVVFRIAAGGRTLALKVHKYNNEAISQSGSPKPNIFFEREHDAYSRLSLPGEYPIAPVPKCYGYMRFTKPPQVNKPGSIPRKLFRSTTYRPAVYTDFLMDQGHKGSIQHDTWRDYFLNKRGDCVLRGLVMEEIVGARHISDSDVSNSVIARSGREGLEALHKRGVLHGDVKNRLNAMFSILENRVIWMDFSKGAIKMIIGNTRFTRKACQEIRDWNGCFKAGSRGP